MFKISENIFLGELVDAHPMASKVLLKHGLDFCCGGQRSLLDACKESKVDIDLILQEFKATHITPVPQLWSSVSNEVLIEHILDNYHASLYEALPHLEGLLNRVVKMHLDKDPECLGNLKDAFLCLSEDLLIHMAKEEQILFPWILGKQDPGPAGPVQCLRIEHERASQALKQMATLTNGYKAPDQACMTWRSLYKGLKNLDYELRMHIHLENNILFPRFMEEKRFTPYACLHTGN